MIINDLRGWGMNPMLKENDDEILSNIIIPPRPSILLKFQQAQEQDADLAYIAELIAQDMGLSAAVLKTINSAYYGLSEKVTSLKVAVSLLGMKQISMLVTGLSLRKIGGSLDFDMFWKHSVETAASSALIAQQLGNINVDDAQLFGLFHDCGKILLSQQFAEYKNTLKIASGFDQSFSAFERHRHGTDHTLVGSLLSSAWCLPTSISLAIRYHHDISAFHDRVLSDQVLSLIALHDLSEYLTNHNNEYAYCEWSNHADEMMYWLQITDNDVADFQSQVNNLKSELGSSN